MAAPLRFVIFNKIPNICGTLSYSIKPTPAAALLVNQCRNVSFFNKINADNLWRGVVGVSNAGRKRGRGKRVGRKKVTDLNKGQKIGSGRDNMQWPGLNAPILRGREVVRQNKLPPNPDREAELVKIREKMGRITYKANPPLLRGWSGSRFPGQSVGPPDPVNDYVFEGFDSRVLQFRLVTNMTGTLGRKQRFNAFVVVGNRNGLAGYGSGSAQLGKAAIRVAKKRAAQNLMYIPRFEDHTVYHNMFTKYHRSQIFIHKKEKGYGLRCHRAIMTTCELMGIKDLHCKVENSTKNIQAVIKGFFNALINQESHQELSDRMGLHVVEFRKERDYYPVVVASPSSGDVRKTEYVDENEDIELDYDRLYYGGKVELERPPQKPFFYKHPGYRKKQEIVHKRRGQHQAQILRRANLW